MSIEEDTHLQQAEPADQLLKKRRLWYYLALALLILSVITRQPLMVLAALFTFLVGIVPEIWYRYALKHLLVRQKVDQSHLFFGEQVTLSVTVENRKFLPLPWLQMENSISPPLTITGDRSSRLQTIKRDTLISTWLLWSYQRVTRRYRMRCHARGFHLFGPLRLNCSDPFGWLDRGLVLPANETLLVYPLIAPIENLGLPSVFPMGEYVGARQLLEDPLWFAGNREYQMGDDPRRIDWKATARVGELRSKIYESTTERHLLILLDTWTYSNESKGMDEELQEYCISAAASLAIWGLDEGYMVGILTNSSMVTATHTFSTEVNTDQVFDEEAARKSNATTISPPGISLPFARDYAHYEQILSTMARLVPTFNTPIERIIEMEDEMFQQGTTILLVSPVNTLSPTTIDYLLERRRHGTAVNIILAGDLEEGKELPDTANLATYNIGGKEQWHELIQAVGDGQNAAIGTSARSLQLD
ncbi:DUF58 domain-containing protein [Dictyobacter aurantiacus]|uniref:DUF58 domain-containing protein n=1 Tax=Dictyobacter aurantiacus TaxID=1936993 RepID=A0A401ZEB8_9CHLR|nr:DUF58 domain-containing protein [Dictyobacter aurantiacus]GCE05227.1 hypothetical protein KDAU_25560 [Dictyobacter aurantiacus]